MMIFTIEEFDDYDKVVYLTNDEEGADVRISINIPSFCYNEKKGEWDDYKMCDVIDGTLAHLFGKKRARVERPHEVYTAEDFPIAIKYTF